MTAIDTTTELDFAIAEALNAEHPCEANEGVSASSCSRPADWYCIRDCGCHVQAWCDRHRQLVIRWLALGTVDCIFCDKTINVRWVPIR